MQSIKSSLKPIFESAKGVHLTIYLVNEGGLENIKAQLRQSLSEALEFLQPVMRLEERHDFLSPFDHLLVDGGLFENMTGNIGLFRSQDSFRILSIPIDLPRSSHVASSFHVKPLLQWIQVDQEFFLLGLDGYQAHLYMGNYHSLQLIDSLPCRLETPNDLIPGEIAVWLRSWIWQRAPRTNPYFFVAGPKEAASSVFKSIKYHRTVREPLMTSFNPNTLGLATTKIQTFLRHQAQKELTAALVEFDQASNEKRTRKNLFQIAKAATLGQIQKLIIASDVLVHGRIDMRTGGLSLHPFDLDHEDDDILDDLAQAVLARGGEVFVVPREQLPKGRSALAILDRADQSPLELKLRSHDNEGRSAEAL